MSDLTELFDQVYRIERELGPGIECVTIEVPPASPWPAPRELLIRARWTDSYYFLHRFSERQVRSEVDVVQYFIDLAKEAREDALDMRMS